ncbi:hypothetical protein KC345_g2310 [Hortaea werneckii]|nr:hypothetical protein KC345_g2310 [Hortaea werneckii]
MKCRLQGISINGEVEDSSIYDLKSSSSSGGDSARHSRCVLFAKEAHSVDEGQYTATRNKVKGREDRDTSADALATPPSVLDRAAVAVEADNVSIEPVADEEIDEDEDADELPAGSPDVEECEEYEDDEQSGGSEVAEEADDPEDCGNVSRPEAIQRGYRRVLKEEGINSMVHLALHDDLQANSTLQSDNFEVIGGVAYLIGIATHPKVLDSILRSSLRKDYKSDRELRSILDDLRIHQRAQTRPAVYCQQLADTFGDLPSVDRVRGAISLARSYVDGSDSQYISRIDRMGNTSRTKKHKIPTHYRRYMFSENASGGLRLSQIRVKRTSAFLDALEKRCLNVPVGEHHKPLPGWLSEFGYTHSTEQRFNNHQNHRSSNYIMNLLSRILDLEWPQQYFLHQFVVFACTAANQASVAEVLFTRLGVAFIEDGGGFTHYAPGLSNDSAQWYDTTSWEAATKEKRGQQLYDEMAAKRAETDARIRDLEATFSPEAAKNMRELCRDTSKIQLTKIRDQMKAKVERMQSIIGDAVHPEGDLVQRAAKAIRIMRATSAILAEAEAEGASTAKSERKV